MLCSVIIMTPYNDVYDYDDDDNEIDNDNNDFKIVIIVNTKMIRV